MEIYKKIRVASYNIKHGADVDKEARKSGAEARAEAFAVLAKDITDLDLDIVGLQEVDRFVPRSSNTDNLALLAEHTGYNYAYYMEAVVFPSPEGATAGSAILSRYPITFGETVELSRGNTWDQVRKLGHVEIDVDGSSVHFFNTHLTPLDRPMRDREFALIREHTKDKTHVFLTGDFNVPTFEEFAVLSNMMPYNNDENKLITYPRDQKFMDNILYSGEFVPRRGGVVENFHSDHNLLWAEFAWK